jgi:hypothetical protein
MNKLVVFYFLLSFLIGSQIATGQEKLKRSEGYFGFHFDFHATATDKELGKNFDTDLLEIFLQKTRPDFIQIDSKGHPGFSSYPTKVGTSPNSFVSDPLRIWKEVAEKHNITVCVHYSGLREGEAFVQNPKWGRLKADGTRDLTRAGYFTGYSDSLLIPQIKELIDNYQIDGAWVDGECWAAMPDYSPENVEGFIQKTGLKKVPVDPEDEYYELWKEHNRNAFKRYMHHYVEEIHKCKPGFQITGNWAYSSRMPEPVDVDLDFLSGDVSGKNCVYSAAFEARCLALQGKPWDMMSWGLIPVNFWGGIHTIKPIIQLKQEAAEILAMGGGFQVYFRQNRDGAFQTLDTEGLANLAHFCRDRQPFCQHSETIPQIGIWYSKEGWKEEHKQSDHIYGTRAFNYKMKEILNLLLDIQLPVEILMDHHIRERMTQYSLIVIPEWTSFDEEIKTQVINYIKEGGSLLVIGAKTSQQFKDILNVSYEHKETADVELIIGGKELGGFAGLKTSWQRVIPIVDLDVEEIGQIYSQTDYRYGTGYPVATVNRCGKGKIGAIYTDLSQVHEYYRNPVFNNLLKTVVNLLDPYPILKVEGSNEVHTVLGRKNGNILIHLINSSGHHADENFFGYNELRPTPELNISLKVNAQPQKVILQPYGKELKFNYINGDIKFSVPPIEVYDIVVVILDNY